MNVLCLELTPKECITYDMPDWMADAMKRGFDQRLFKRMKTFVDMLPSDLRALVRVTRKPHPPVVKGPEINWVFYDELASQEAIKAAIEYEESKRK